MRIGVDATCWQNRRGYGRFTRELLPALVDLAPDVTFVCFVPEHEVEGFDLDRANVHVRPVALAESPTEAASADGSRGIGDILRLTRAVAGERLDVFFSPSVYTYFPLPPRLRAVITVHDAIAERFPDLTLPSRRARLFWRMKVGLALWQATLVLTVSEFAADEIVRELQVPRSRLRVAVEAPAPHFAHPVTAAAVDAAAVQIGLAGSDRWFIYVGGFSPHKNVEVLVRAHAAVARGRRQPPHLVLVGATSGDPFLSEVPRIRAAIDAEGTAGLVHWAGRVPDADLAPLYAGAVALVLPSECEGFGLPAVEAAACGTAVIATTESPLPQLLEGGGLFVPPGDRDALEAAMRTLADDEPRRGQMAAGAAGRARALTWTRTAAAALAAITQAADLSVQ